MSRPKHWLSGESAMQYHAFYVSPISLGKFLNAVYKSNHGESLEIVTIKDIDAHSTMLVLLKLRWLGSGFLVGELRDLEKACI